MSKDIIALFLYKSKTVFHELFLSWEQSNYSRKLTPSVDRIDSSKGYYLGNMEWVTHSENSKIGSHSNIKKIKNSKRVKILKTTDGVDDAKDGSGSE